MIKAVVDGVNIFNPVENKIDEIIDCFVDFYGEKYRDRITKRLKDAKYFFVPREGNFNITDRINSYYNNKIQELETELFFSFPLYEPRKYSIFNMNIARAINERLLNGKLNISDYSILDDVIELFNLSGNFLKGKDSKETINSQEWLKERKNVNTLKKFLASLITEWDSNYALEVSKLRDERDIALMQVKDYDMEYKKNKQKADGIIKKAVILYLSEKTTNQNNSDRLKVLTASDLYISILKMGKTEFMRKGKMYYNFFKECIGFFNALGFNLGGNIEAYKNNKELMDIIFNPKINRAFENATAEAQKHEVLNNPYINDIFSDMLEMKFKNNDRTHIISMLAFASKKYSADAFVREYLDENNDIVNICICGDGLDVCDDSLFHEMNHIIETDLLSVNNDGFVSKCGFDIVEFDANPHEVPENIHRKYEYLNEVINDYFAIRISRIAEAKGVKPCLGENISSLYSHCFPVLKEFINKYKDSLIKARMSDDPLMFAKFFGEEKYNRLAELVNEYFGIILDENKFTRILLDVSIKTGSYGNPLNRLDQYAKMNVHWAEDTQKMINCYKEIKKLTEDGPKLKKDKCSSALYGSNK